MLQQAADLGVDTIWIDALNRRPKVWPAVAELLRAHFPDLLPCYRKILFDEPYRDKYLDELCLRINHAVKQASLTGRVTACM